MDRAGRGKLQWSAGVLPFWSGWDLPFAMLAANFLQDLLFSELFVTLAPALENGKEKRMETQWMI